MKELLALLLIVLLTLALTDGVTIKTKPCGTACTTYSVGF